MATVDGGTESVAHTFCYVRGSYRDIVLRLLRNGLVSYDWKTLHGSWGYGWGAPTRKRGIHDQLQMQAR